MFPVLPEVLEIKRTLDGRQERFRCGAVDLAPPGSAVLAYLSPEAVEVAGIELPAGTLTLGYFWVDRPYNTYHWLAPSGATLGCYFNLADHTRIGAEAVEWRDLALDLLVTPDGGVRLLDEDELPAGLPPAMRDEVERGRAALLADPRGLAAGIERCSRRLRAALFAGGAR